ncbi:MAG: HipA domain-containing protein [Gammaproteobacteria bacterium]|nr:HipA domain-containing protein [Gammaproteobacteria bacterium]
MNRCPITYEPCGEARYSRAGLRLLSPNLEQLNDFPYDAGRQRQEAVVRAGKTSIQGVQPKLSVRLNAKAGAFEIVDQGGRFVLKPQHAVYPNLPENEGLTMHLAKLCGIEAPASGIVRCVDGTWSYFVRRFDRTGHNRKVAVEDFAQLAGMDRDTKYEFSMERLVRLLDQYCTFPAIEKVKLLKRSLFNFLVGNEDMHLKNFSLITRQGKVEFAPAYDYLSTTVAYLALGRPIDAIEEIALPLQGKKRRLARNTWTGYFAKERLELPDKVIDTVLDELARAAPEWRTGIAGSFLPPDQKDHYRRLLDERCEVLAL